MQYIKVKWVHSHPDEPEWLYSELDDERWERRKVEVYADTTCSFANSDQATGTSKLSVEPIPTLEEIASDPQFIPQEITSQEFEDVWAKCHDSR
jgi:hypothetical protein